MEYLLHDHRQGEKTIAEKLRHEVAAAVKESTVKLVRGNATKLRDDILAHLEQKGWPPKVVIDPSSKISITSMKDRVGLCLQTGNMGRMYADLLKLQTVYLREAINAGVFIVPGKHAAKKLGDNVVNFDRLVRELQIFERTITVPILVVGLAN